MNESELHESLDRRGLLDKSRGTGTYALRVDTPDDAESVAREWLEVREHAPEGLFERVATADRVCYVGASDHVYDRLCDHVAGEYRKATFLEAFGPPTTVVGMWPVDGDRDAAEYNRAVTLSQLGWLCWHDGGLIG